MSVNRKLLFFSTVFSTIPSAVFTLPTAGDELSAAVAEEVAWLLLQGLAHVASNFCDNGAADDL